jgi:hypothetical protein
MKTFKQFFEEEQQYTEQELARYIKSDNPNIRGTDQHRDILVNDSDRRVRKAARE